MTWYALATYVGPKHQSAINAVRGSPKIGLLSRAKGTLVASALHALIKVLRGPCPTRAFSLE